MTYIGTGAVPGSSDSIQLTLKLAENWQYLAELLDGVPLQTRSQAVQCAIACHWKAGSSRSMDTVYSYSTFGDARLPTDNTCITETNTNCSYSRFMGTVYSYITFGNTTHVRRYLHHRDKHQLQLESLHGHRVLVQHIRRRQATCRVPTTPVPQR